MDMVSPLQKWRDLRISAGAPQIDHKITRHDERDGVAAFPRDDRQHQVDASGDASARQTVPVLDIKPVPNRSKRCR